MFCPVEVALIVALAVVAVAAVAATPVVLFIVFRHQERMRVEGGTFLETVRHQRDLEAQTEKEIREQSEAARLERLRRHGDVNQRAFGA